MSITETLDWQLSQHTKRLVELRDEARRQADKFEHGVNRECYRERASTYAVALHDLHCWTKGAYGVDLAEQGAEVAA